MRYQQVHDPLHAARKNHQRRINQIVPNITPVSSNKRLEIRFRLATPISDLMVAPKIWWTLQRGSHHCRRLMTQAAERRSRSPFRFDDQKILANVSFRSWLLYD